MPCQSLSYLWPCHECAISLCPILGDAFVQMEAVAIACCMCGCLLGCMRAGTVGRLHDMVLVTHQDQAHGHMGTAIIVIHPHITCGGISVGVVSVSAACLHGHTHTCSLLSLCMQCISPYGGAACGCRHGDYRDLMSACCCMCYKRTELELELPPATRPATRSQFVAHGCALHTCLHSLPQCNLQQRCST